MYEIFNHVVLTVFVGIKSRDTSTGKILLHKDESIIGSKCVWNYRAAVYIINYLQGSTRPKISMAVHQFSFSYNNQHLVHKRSLRKIAKYLASKSTYVDLPYGNRWLSTHGLVYNKEKGVDCYVDS